RLGMVRHEVSDGRLEGHRQRAITSSLRTQPVCPFSNFSRTQPSANEPSSSATLPAGRAVVFCVVSASVGMERNNPGRHAMTARLSALIPYACKLTIEDAANIRLRPSNVTTLHVR